MTSGPVRNSSTTTRSPEEPNFFSSIRECRALVASCSFWAMKTPLPTARPSALITAGYLSCSLIYASASVGEVKTSYLAVGMPYFFIRFFENTLLLSISAANLLGPKQVNPPASRKSTIPAPRGSSGATNTRSTFFSFARASIPSLSIASTLQHSASVEMPPLPGAQ